MAKYLVMVLGSEIWCEFFLSFCLFIIFLNIFEEILLLMIRKQTLS